MARKGQKKTWPFLDPTDPEGMPVLRLLWLDALRTRGYSDPYQPVAKGTSSGTPRASLSGQRQADAG